MTRQDRLLKAKIPGPETGIEIRKSICDICTPSAHCGLDVYVKDGVILKVEGTKGFPRSDGKLCTKGACNRQYVYREGRLKSPMRRTVSFEGPDFHLSETLASELRLSAERLLRDKAVRPY